MEQKTGTLDHSLLNDLLEEFGDQEDVQDALAILFSGPCAPSFSHRQK
jgi:hypothetical protein